MLCHLAEVRDDVLCQSLACPNRQHTPISPHRETLVLAGQIIREQPKKAAWRVVFQKREVWYRCIGNDCLCSQPWYKCRVALFF